MKTSVVYRSLVTAAPQVHPNLFVKRDGNTCGDLQGHYSNVQAPVCSDSMSICTFDGSLQGCCNDSGVCQFYTTCVGLYAPTSCVGSLCLPCSSQAPYCVKYNFWDAESQKAYDGYSCAAFQATQTIWGIATSVLALTLTSSSSSAAATSSSISSESTGTPILTRFNLTESTSSSFNSSSRIATSTFTSSTESTTASSSLSKATSLPPTAAKHVSHTGTIAGGVVGALVLLALIGVGICCFRRRDSTRGGNRRLPYVGSRVGEMQQVYEDDDGLRPRAR